VRGAVALVTTGQKPMKDILPGILIFVEKLDMKIEKI
jgi:hypothetical protein